MLDAGAGAAVTVSPGGALQDSPRMLDAGAGAAVAVAPAVASNASAAFSRSGACCPSAAGLPLPFFFFGMPQYVLMVLRKIPTGP